MVSHTTRLVCYAIPLCPGPSHPISIYLFRCWRSPPSTPPSTASCLRSCATPRAVEQHGQSDPSAVAQLGSGASSGHAWRLWAARHSQGEDRPLGAQPLPRVLELAASKAAHLTAFDHSGGDGAARRGNWTMWKTRPIWPASAAQAADWPRLAEARGSLRHDLALEGASGEPAGRGLSRLVFHIGTGAYPSASAERPSRHVRHGRHL
eukprot:scaffold70427_cov57-Phaeocystis_antarctica.AAC.2